MLVVLFAINDYEELYEERSAHEDTREGRENSFVLRKHKCHLWA